MISEHSAHLTPLWDDFRTWLWRYTYLLLLISMLWHRQAIFKSKGDKLCSSAECRIWTRGPRHQIASRLNARWQTNWAIEDEAKNLNSTARPYDQRAFSPLDPTVIWLSQLAQVIYIFVVVNFDALAQTGDIQIETRQVVFLCRMQDLNPGSHTPNRQQNRKETSCVPLQNAGFEPRVPDTKSPADSMLADKPTELSRIKLKTWTRQPVPMISEHSAHLTPLSVDFRTWLWRYTYLLLLFRCSGTGKRNLNRKETSCVPLQNAGFEPGVQDTKSPADWMVADKPIELSRIKLKTWTRQPVPMISEHSAHLTPLSVDFRTWLWPHCDIHICCC